MQENFNRFASYVFWAFLAFIILSAIFAPELWHEVDDYHVGFEDRLGGR